KYPFTRMELKKIGKSLHENTEIIGGYLFLSHFIIKRRLIKLFGMKRDIKKIKCEIGTPLDKYFSPAIIAVYTKNIKKKEK
ncbi:MAG: hypothetical protein PHV68_10535, partial [Candidatus Gastranaerophilales bacterium]|nr:hypothetical protein [Candidatus Gastranaerophilales bacterium]